ncbi:MAG: hypothetical protein JXA10_12840 [Anaerolineae bacterium]|nr:hypothetical protein [Anaerolineae bacterium]
MTPDFTFTRRDMLIGLLIVALAFGLRMVIIMDRAHAPNEISVFDPLPSGLDQTKYVRHITDYQAGTFPPPRYWYQPGISWFLIASSAIIRTTNLGALRVWIAALASLNCGVFVLTTRLAFGRRWVSALAGFLLAIYPVGAFYDTDFVITSQATELLTLALTGILLLWRFPPKHEKGEHHTQSSPSLPAGRDLGWGQLRITPGWLGVALYGLSFGAMAITRFEPIFLAPVFGLWLIGVRRDWRAVSQVAIAALLCLIVIAPTAIHNLSDGADYLITPVGNEEIYRGNNRDTGGNYGGGMASYTTHDDYLHYLWNDIKLSPRRFIELELHKIGMFFARDEPGNNLNYHLSGEDVSPLLRAIPLDLRIMIALGLFGLFAALRQRERAAGLLAASFVVLMLAIMLIWVEGRLRTPVIVFVAPLAAYGLVYAVERFPLRYTGRSWQVNGPDARYIALAIAGTALTITITNTFYYDLPRQETTSNLPDAAHPADITYDQTLKLLGWQIQEDYSRAGIISPFKPYVVSLYWQLLAPTTTDYNFALHWYVDEDMLAGVDHPIGYVSYPHTTTSTWEANTIYVEHIPLGYKKFTGPTGKSGLLTLSVYSDPNAYYMIPAEGVPGSPWSIELARPALIWGEGKLPDDLTLLAEPIRVGRVLELQALAYPCAAATGSTIDVTLGWHTTAHPIRESYIMGVYVMNDSGDTLYTQYDSPPHDGDLLTTSLPENYLFDDTKRLPLPDDPGEYTLFAAVYNYQTMTRLAVADSPHDLIRLGTITLTASAPDADAAESHTCYAQ